ncbi:CAP domain-containing protein [Desulfovibrio sp. OttesenSCG-928-I05]|nr:CAP domain-containing protein [Desulfovibrio sp. OttesenSCG-928-I05]
MNTRRAQEKARFSAFLLLCAVLFLCSVAASGAWAASRAVHNAHAGELAALINAERQKSGFPAVTIDQQLCAAADARMKELMQQFRNTRPNGGSTGDLLTARSIKYRKFVHSYFRGFSLPARIMRELPKYETGVIRTAEPFSKIGVATGEDSSGKVYWSIIGITTAAPVPTGTYAAQKKALLQLINAERKRLKRSALDYDDRLEGIAQTRAVDLQKKYSGNRPDGSGTGTLFKARNVTVASFGQYYARGFKNAAALDAAWKKQKYPDTVSAAHYTRIGIGISADNKGQLYWDIIASSPVQRPPTLSELEAYQRDVLRLTNVHRAANGLPALAGDTRLDAVAAVRAEEVLRSFSHTRPDGSEWTVLLDKHSIPWRANAENIAAGQKNAEAVVEAWMNSPGHRANILSKNVTRLGVGARINADGRIGWVQTFIKPK